MELQVIGKLETTGTVKNSKGESVYVDVTRYKLKNADGSVKVSISCTDLSIDASEDDVLELRPIKSQSRLSIISADKDEANIPPKAAKKIERELDPRCQSCHHPKSKHNEKSRHKFKDKK